MYVQPHTWSHTGIQAQIQLSLAIMVFEERFKSWGRGKQSSLPYLQSAACAIPQQGSLI